jgi:hypothetical protein
MHLHYTKGIEHMDEHKVWPSRMQKVRPFDSGFGNEEFESLPHPPIFAGVA